MRWIVWSVSFVDCRVALTLYYLASETILYIVRNPFCYILCCRVEGQYIVKDGMVEFAEDEFLHMCEVRHHPVLVEIFGTTFYVKYPVMAVHCTAFALIIEVKPVGG